MLYRLPFCAPLTSGWAMRWCGAKEQKITAGISMDTGSSDALILDYWRRRKEGLSEAEWHDFYQRVMPLLLRTNLGPDYADPQKREDLAHIFFTEKIFLNAETTAAGPLENVHALHGYLKNFARDLQRKEGHYTGLDLDSARDDESPDRHADMAHNLSSSAASTLNEAGIDVADALRSADEFLGRLDDGEAAYLRLHGCSDEDEREPISSIAKRLALGSSYHYKARLLGITRSKGETPAGYGKTKIGAWLLSLGATLSGEWREEIALLLQLLCLRAISLRMGGA